MWPFLFIGELSENVHIRSVSSILQFFTFHLLHSIGTIYHKTGQPEKALECFEASLRLKKKHYVGGHLSVAETMNVLALSYDSLGKKDDAISSFEEALTIYEKKFGAHATTASILDSLGSVSLSKGSLNKAHGYFERALALKRLVYGDEDVEVSNTLFYVGKVQSKSGDMDDALNTFKEGKFKCLHHA